MNLVIPIACSLLPLGAVALAFAALLANGWRRSFGKRR